MYRLSLFAALAFALCAAIKINTDDLPIVNDKIVSHINSLKSTWTASTKQGGLISGITRKEAKRLMGVKRDGKGPVLPRKTYTDEEHLKVPASFDSRTNWPQCLQMRRIRDQSACGSCWAFAAVEAMSDRECIVNHHNNLSISAQDLNSCCDSCGDGCDGGYPSAAWEYYVNTGIVDSNCAPYSLPSCDHHLPNSTHPCPSDEYPTPPCPSSCVDGDNWNSDLWFGQTAYSLSGEEDMMTEIYQNGPVETAFSVYEDFLSYKTGVYQHTTGDYLGGHAVKILGWGVQGGQKYWLVANSWNPDWGAQGYFMILKGVDECGFEDEVDAGIPAPKGSRK